MIPPDTSLLQYQDILRINVPSTEHVTLLQAWMEKEKPLDDAGKDYLADIEPRGVWERQRLKFAREPRELASLDMKYDSILARIVRKTPLGQFYLVGRSISPFAVPRTLVHLLVTGCEKYLTHLFVILTGDAH